MRGERALLISDRRVRDGGVLKIARRISEVRVAGWPVTGRRRGGRSQHYVLQASNGGVLAT